jgi:ketosteroid isomerase-like protein
VVAPAIDGRTAERDARGLVRELYDTIDRGNLDSMFALLTDTLVVFGPRRDHATVTRADALLALGQVVDRKAKRPAVIRSGGLTVVVSDGGRSAWLADTGTFGARPLAVTAVLTNANDLWAVAAAVIAETPNAQKARAEGARDAIVPPGAAATSKPGPGVEAAIERFRDGLLDPQRWGDELASHADAVVIGPIAGEVARGKAAIKRLWKARVAVHTRAVITGELAGAVSADGQLAWISAPVTRVADGAAPLPLRAFAVYEKAGAAWTLIALHEALAVGEPGSGTAWKQIVPPALVPPPPKLEPAGKAGEPAGKKQPRPRQRPRPKARG